MSRGLALPRDPSEWGFKGENYLLVIGIDKYEHWKPLRNAVKDIGDIVEVLTSRYQFEPDRIIRIIDDEATEDGIRSVLIDVKRRITQEDNLVVLFSGHGYYDEDLEEGYWVPVDARKGKPSDYISNSDLLKWIRAIKTHHTLILIDSCFSGTLISQSRSEVLSERYPSSRVFASGRKELVDDGVAGDNSPFAKAVLTNLRRNNERVLRASDLISAVIKNVESLEGQVPVEGRIKDAADEGGEFVFHLKATEEEIWQSIIAHDTSEEYRKYCEYFPEGKYRSEAETRIRHLTDDSAWNQARARNTTEAITDYLETHPDGKHYDEALALLQDIEEQSVWRSTRTKGTMAAYLEFLRRFPDSDNVSEARRQIELLKGQADTMSDQTLEREIEKIEEEQKTRVDDKEKFKEALRQAESLFADERFNEAIAKYGEVIGLHKPSFVPGTDYLEERIRDAKKGLQYVELFNEGKDAVKAGNFELALQYFEKAKSYNSTQKIDDWIKHCKQKIEYQQPPVRGESPVAVKLPKKPVKKKKSRVGLIIFLVLFFLVGFVVLIGVIINEIDSNSGSDPYYQDYSQQLNSQNNYDDVKGSTDYTEEPLKQSEPVYSNPKSTTPTLDAEFLSGTWYVYDRVIGTLSTRDANTLSVAYYRFYQNGNLDYTEAGYSYSGYWDLYGNTLEVSFTNLTGWNGQITDYDNSTIIWVTNEYLLGVPVVVTNRLTRQ